MQGNPQKNIDAIFEGGGVKGSGLVGAVAVAEELGFHFVNLAGTSAGAIIAGLVAAGYTARELKQIMDDLDYGRFKDTSLLGGIPIIGAAASIVFKKGIYEGDFFYHWMRDLLLKKGISTFKDFIIDEYKDDMAFRYKLQVVASDISRGQLLVLPRDAADFGVHPDDLEVALAVRMSMSIPYFYKPVKLHTKDHQKVYIVDGGLLSNYPVWLLDEATNAPEWPTLGFKLVEPEEGRPHKIYGPLTLFAALFSTLMEAHDARDRFGCQTEFGSKAIDQMLAAPADLLGERGDPRAAGGERQPAIGEYDLG